MTKGWLIGGAVFLGVLLVASITVALLEREEPLTEGTPEATVQSFLGAVEDDDFELAYSYLSEDLKRDCTVERFFGTSFRPGGRLKDGRITLERTKMVDDTAFVDVRVTRFHRSGPFGSSESSFGARFTLRQEEAQWRFTEYPWPLSGCGPYEPFPVGPVPRPPAPTSTPSPVPTPTAGPAS